MAQRPTSRLATSSPASWMARARPITMLVAAGSGGAAGLVADAAGHRRPWRSSLPPKSPARGDGDESAHARAGIAERLGLQPANVSDVDVRDARGPGYGIPSEEGEQATQLAAATEGLLLDPVFTAKALGLLLAAQELPGPVVFWHTGGQVAALAHLVGLSAGDGDMKPGSRASRGSTSARLVDAGFALEVADAPPPPRAGARRSAHLLDLRARKVVPDEPLCALLRAALESLRIPAAEFP